MFTCLRWFTQSSAWQFWKLIRQELLQRSHTNPAKHQLPPPLLLMHFLAQFYRYHPWCNVHYKYQYVQCNLSTSANGVQQQLQVQMSITQQVIWYDLKPSSSSICKPTLQAASNLHFKLFMHWQHFVAQRLARTDQCKRTPGVSLPVAMICDEAYCRKLNPQSVCPEPKD